ncbi:FimV/HubP family polar landmark protein [uncultured Thiocystis sp.]|jgi:pilus assembly protein FimV|uniref:FimV/HubP family polar landmark protein n=1 Tax=uncultured Thiocystis sp. TaxID=1202134 RepID=UPI0025EB2863|nr:FimV/HubP family polar landmark protein [uncultured Thiocystis sp.]
MTMILAGTDASALGLGGIRTLSVLNQPFSGEIDIHDVNPDELDAIKVSIASQEAFNKAGIERYYYLTKLTFTPGLSPQGKPVIRVSSREPIREPYMDVLVDINWPRGQLVKEYTILLDPPVLANRRAPRVDTPQAVGARSGGAPGISRVTSSPSNHIPAPGDGFPIYIGPIESGAGLWRLALNHAPAGATTAQTAMALHRNNQGAFSRGNINRLIAGKTLIIPTREELFALDAAAAEREFAAALRGGAVRRAPITAIPPEALSSRLRIAGAVPSDAAVPSASAGVPIAGPTAAVPAPRMEQDLLLALETSESARQEAVELRQRIKDLETQLADIQNLLTQRNAEVERIKGNDVAPGVLGEVTREVVPKDSDLDSKVLAESVSGELSSKATTQPPEGAPLATELPLLERLPADFTNTRETSSESESAQTAGPANELIPIPVPTPAVSQSGAALDQVGQQTPASRAVAPIAAQDPGSEASAAEPSSTWQSLMLPVAGFAALTALGVLAFSWLTARRRRREEDRGETELSLDRLDFSEPEDATRLHATLTPEEAAVKTRAERESSFGTPLVLGKEDDEEPESPLSLMSSLSDFDAETDEADVLSEADIYIAYGRHLEARELLLKEMARYPDRLDIKFKLAEAYAGAQDARGLEKTMQSIEAAGGDRTQPGQWKRLQDLSAQTQSGQATGSDMPAPMAAVGAAPARESGQASPGDLMTDSLDLTESDSLLLDLSGIQRGSAEPFEQTAAREPIATASEPRDDSPLQFSDDVLGDILTEPANLDDLVLEEELLDLGLPLHSDDGQKSLNRDLFADIAHEPTSDESELVLTLDDTSLDVAEELDSMFDSRLEDEPTLARNELAGTHPSGTAESPMVTLGKQELSGSGLHPEQESVPTEDLSSQWQMDSGIWDETATKLDLARAYLEMDDAEAAREILQEVIAEGRDEQKIEARALLERLA